MRCITGLPVLSCRRNSRLWMAVSCASDLTRKTRMRGRDEWPAASHAVIACTPGGTLDQRIPLWSVMPLNWDERVVAMELARLAPHSALALADANYDSGPLYDRLAERGIHLLTPMRRKNPGGGHRTPSPARLAAAHAWNGAAGYVY